MSSREDIQVDWLIILLYGLLVIFGWINIYAATYDPVQDLGIFSFKLESGKQLLWIGGSLALIIVIMAIDFKFYEYSAYIFHILFIVLLGLVLVIGSKVGGARSWFDFGIFKFQPSEFAKFATALAVAKYIGSTPGFRFSKPLNLAAVAAMVGIPTALILLQPDAGTMIVFASFILVFYREGLSPAVIWVGLGAVFLFILTLMVSQVYIFIGIAILAVGIAYLIWRRQGLNRIVGLVLVGAIVMVGYVLSVDYMFNNVLKSHQQKRILLTLNLAEDPNGYGYNLMQSQTTIASGGIWGKGFLEGDRTQTGWVPAQSTDFIFTTLAEEHGWIGSTLVVVLFAAFLLRLIYLAERQKARFSRVYGYSVFGIFFLHIMINVAMTMGLFPVVGIPLPFFSYGGSSLWSFTILLFILIKLDAHRGQVLMR